MSVLFNSDVILTRAMETHPSKPDKSFKCFIVFLNDLTASRESWEMRKNCYDHAIVLCGRCSANVRGFLLL